MEWGWRKSGGASHESTTPAEQQAMTPLTESKYCAKKKLKYPHDKVRMSCNVLSSVSTRRFKYVNAITQASPVPIPNNGEYTQTLNTYLVMEDPSLRCGSVNAPKRTNAEPSLSKASPVMR